ncbi:MAG: hypothetical protein ACP5G4_08675 [bacterium]
MAKLNYGQRRVVNMAEDKGIPRGPVEHLALLSLCSKKDDDPGTLADYKFLPIEKDALSAALAQVQTTYDGWLTRSDEYGELTAQWLTLEKDAFDLIGSSLASSGVYLIRMKADDQNVTQKAILLK